MGKNIRQSESCPHSPKALYETDEEFVAALIGNNTVAWEYFVDFSSGIMSRHKRYLADLGLGIDELLSETYLYLTENGSRRLRSFQEESEEREGGKSFRGYLAYKVLAVRKKMLSHPRKKRKLELSDSLLEFPLVDQKAKTPEEKSSQQHRREIMNQAFHVLWQHNSRRACIYLMRRKLKLPSKQVAKILGIEKVNIVDVTLKRSEAEMEKILREMGVDNAVLSN